ncbi:MULTISPECIES: hypothetical protein [unclassified Streptomyces]|uniref:hypothetical protein n=1 Tax=unclassified Streptomyces TaxID=2593676 RepID=UPI002DD940BD|nr:MULTISPECIES: hypothetical protein [unclassified Streptomyces]WSA95542.1 hypothetical protein OIE63_31200 [Streptomyces sp. NBC_01795]WSB79956.1 hypothetical protein OHB04_32310 [Streptomyces sp. NBC_01775]WSS11836.1 hypothetical protein OG533_07900 [Streptomyces sp. NBC_01186]WSS40551.1 hypothetical protein OG220_08060 [Streptomyces sp. NBC_01187]
MGDSGTDPVERGFPHLETVREAITALYRRMSTETIRTFDTSVAPGDVAFADADDLHLGVQRVAGVMVRHLRLPEARVIVTFREMTHAANVELAAGPEYFVELNSRFKTHRRDIGAALAHEVMHVYLHRLGLAFAGTRDNEILTDTATAYLGAGWLLLDAFRQDSLSSQKLGYLTPEEFGYVLAKRARVFGEDPAIWFTSPQAYEAYVRGSELAGRDEERPPLAGSHGAGRRRYAKDRRYAQVHLSPGSPPLGNDIYAFEHRSPLRVSFSCPTCRQRIRVPVRGRVRARCGLCGTVLECDT